MEYLINKFYRFSGPLIFLCIVIFLSQPITAQRTDAHWFPYFAQFGGPLPSGPKVSTIAPNGDIYVAGNSGNDVRVAKWDGIVWQVLGDRLSSASVGQADVFAIAVDSNEDVYVGGLFDLAYNNNGTSDPVSNIAKFIAATNSWESVGQGVDNSVSALAVDPGNNNVYVGGNFITGTNSSGATVTLIGIARWNITTQVWEKLGEGVTTIAGFPGEVQAAAVESNGNLIIGGNFDKAYQIGGAIEVVNSIARWNVSSLMWEKFGQGVSPIYSIVNNIALDANDILYIAGNFQFAVNPGGSMVPGPITKWDGSQWISYPLLGFDISIAVDGNNTLFVLYYSPASNTILVDRWVTNQWETIGNLQFEGASTIATNLSNPLEYLYLGGRYNEIINPISGNTTIAKHHAEWDGSDWTPLNLPIGAGGEIHAIQSDRVQDYVYVGGDFTTISGIPFNHIARVDGNFWEGLGFGLNGSVYEIHAEFNSQFSRDVFVGGDFDFATNPNGSIVALNNVGRWNATLEQWERFGFGVNGPVYAIQFLWDAAGNPEYLYVGGSFNTATNPDNSTITNVGNIVRWSFTQNIWERLGDGVSGGGAPAVRDMIAFSAPVRSLYVGGSFLNATNTGGGQVSSSNIVRLNRFTDTWEAMGQGVDNTVWALGDGRKIWVGGEFSTAITSNGTQISTPYLAFWDGLSDEWLPMGQVNGPVRTIKISPIRGRRYIGGDFTQIGSLAANHIALHEGLVIDAPEGWRTLGSGTDGPVNTIEFIGPCNKIGEVLYVGGSFTMAGNQPAQNIAKWNYGVKIIHAHVHLSSSSLHSSGYRGTVSGASCSGLSSNNLSDYIIFDGLKFRESASADSLPLFESFELTIAPSNDPFNPIVTFDSLIIDNENPNAFLFMGVDDTTLYAPNPDGRSIGLTMLLKGLQVENIQPGMVELLLLNAVTDAPAIDIEAQGVGTLIENLIYGETADSIAIAPGTYTFDVKRNSDGQLLGSYPVDISNNVDEIVIVTVSGFLDPAANQNGPPMSLDVFETSIIVSVEPQDEPSGVVETFRLSHNYPNPFNPSTKIKFSVPQTSFVTLKVYDILGRKITILVNEEKTIGNYEVNFNASNLSSGVYFYRMQAGDFIETKKMVLLQ